MVKWKLEQWVSLCACVGIVVFGTMLILTGQTGLMYGAAALVLILIMPWLLRRLRIKLPGAINSLISVFIFLSMCLGRMLNFYELISGWDLFLHVYSGALLCAAGIYIMCAAGKTITPAAVLGGFCLASAGSVAWEFFEYAVDMLFGLNTQMRTYASEIPGKTLGDYVDKWGRIREAGLVDTMTDLIAGAVGAAVVSAGWIIVKKIRDKKS